MDGSKLQVFRQQAASPDSDRARDSKEPGRLVLREGGKAVQVVRGEGFLSGLVQPRQNREARLAFFNALSTAYGEPVAQRVFGSAQRISSAPLTPDLVRQAIEDAAVTQRVDDLLEGGLRVQVPDLAALESASGHVRASFAGADRGEGVETRHGLVLDTKHAPAPQKVVTLSTGQVGEFGHAKFLARVSVEGRQRTGGAAGARSAGDFMAAGDAAAADLARQGDAARALVGYEKSGALAVDRTAQSILDGAREGNTADVAVQRAVARAMAQMKTPNDARSALYRDFLRNGLLVLAARVMKSDAREGCPLLTRLATRMAEDMDGIVGRAIAGQSRFIGKPHDEVVRSLASNPQRTFSELPRLLTGLDTQMVTFQRTMHDLLGRVEQDCERIGNTLLSGRAPGQLTDIHVTSSDPHHGGQRVMILKFEGAPDTPVVYKPRDCRIDAGIVGNAGTGGVTKSAGALLNQALGARGEIGTYNYLLGGKDRGEYAFIECVKHKDQLPEGANDLEGVKKFFRAIGQFLGLAFVLGLSDIHQGNGIVSEDGQMMFTDLEIGFNRDVLGDESAPLSMAGTMMDKLLGSFEENDYTTPLAIDAAGLIQMPVSRVQTNPTRNFIMFEGRKMSPRDPTYGAAITAALKEGFAEAMAAMARPDVNDAMVSLLDTQFAGKVHVRYHVAPTIAQLDKLEAYRFAAEKPPELTPGSINFEKMDRQAATLKPADGSAVEASRQATWDSVEGFLRQDFQEGDVAYFTRVLGQPDTVLHHDRHGAQPVQDGGRHLAYDGLGRSRTLIRSLRGSPPVAQSQAGTAQPPAGQDVAVDARLSALPAPVRTAFDGFMNQALGINRATASRVGNASS